MGCILVLALIWRVTLRWAHAAGLGSVPQSITDRESARTQWLALALSSSNQWQMARLWSATRQRRWHGTSREAPMLNIYLLRLTNLLLDFLVLNTLRFGLNCRIASATLNHCNEGAQTPEKI